ncbi:MAG: Cation transport ATPase [candidate division WWE3 bacterium GW2011_GWF2_41_45]|uniref:Cation-transporting P-type ATPase N-terminal domain-containing protein n=2 Tax=Katanobacteria TaxID=422282 RepID=A0A1F4W2M7_UNCKA|nr:MAG: Cation transport ATPase [candidate division WWE3 bacterium GW2011_GWC2_41_23]KKS08923.1 MAG: Cation transport ATPase [candidate division WWE3 bacterium GW2011_GWF2_41_45]KKS11827.1 MAG: Cation transport ATPase [candidate division WWE3 bacterium GW2011_GWF1_41_53]KKS19513.1 MAG: Cation transport ATPase [candidate division WWE3 bacterium GW2011_GWE1_41_72]KKS30071.1 MAG: Cation transport ATPase [candidate division WWE3 bacterium GW2011_GWD2_42_11]KKS50120.1 MAG: Cation transport ATPase [
MVKYPFLTEEKGLTSTEIVERQEQYGLNILPEKAPPSKFYLFSSQLKSPLVYVLLASAVVTFFIGEYANAFIILLAVAINTTLGFIQEYRTSNALAALKKFISDEATVIRDGNRVLIDTSQIVPGDIVILGQGDKIPADGKILSSNRLHLNESILTGESAAVEKVKDDELYMGTTVVSGQAVMQVEATGTTTKMGKIAQEIQEEKEVTPLQRQLKSFSKQLLIVIGVLVTVVFVVGLIHKFSLVEIFTTSVALAVSSIPEGLLVSLTVVLAVGMQKILKRKGLVRKLAAAETLGGVTVICVDKTGTLTQGQMEVVDFIGNEKELAVQTLLANDLDDPIVISAYEWGKQIMGDPSPGLPRIDSIPFSSKERFFICLSKWTDDKNMIFVNGAPEILLQGTTLTKDEKSEIHSSIDKLTKQGKRVVGFARKEVNIDKQVLDNDDAKSDLTWVGLLVFSDPVRMGVKDVLEQARIAGIRVVVITGDYANTSEFVLSELEISVSKDEIMTGDQLAVLSAEELTRHVKNIRLFARTTPDQKLLIVEALKNNGEVVAMIGDGVNDAPALHKSDIGVVVGESSDVAKESADLVLLDSNFSTIIGAIEEGRVMFENIRKVTLYLLCDAFGEIIVVLGGIILGLPLPLTAVQILWINLVSDGFPNLALTVDPKRKDIMYEAPRSSKELLVNKKMVFLIAFVSFLVGLIALSSFIYIYNSTGDVILARSVTFITIGLNSLVYVFAVKDPKKPFWKNHLFNNKYLIMAVFAGLALQFLPFSTAASRQFFVLSALTVNYWLVAFGFSISVFFSIELFKKVVNRSKPINIPYGQTASHINPAK